MFYNDWEEVGEIGVDSGICWVGDPCYCVTPDAENHPAKTWEEFCNILEKNESEKGTDYGTMQWNYNMGHSGLGVSVNTGYGDGTYPVYVRRSHGRIAEVKVVFIEDENE